MSPAVLGPLDYAVIVGYLLAITAFGSWFARFQKTTRDYFLTGHSVPAWAICCTIVATETSTLSFIGVPAQSYAGNMTFLQLVFGYIVGRFLVSAIFLPAYFRGELFTTYELLQQRFGPSVKNLSAIVFLVTRSLADGIRLYATALVISVVTQTNVSLVVVVLGAAMIVYTMRGGVAAVIWTDVVQLFVYVAGALIVFASLVGQIDGGLGAALAAGREAGKLRVFDFAVDATRVYTFWAGLFGGIALTLATHGTDQFLVQRLLSARSLRDARIGLMASGFIVFAQFCLFLLIGILLFAFYQQTPLPVPLDRNDKILSIYVIHSLRYGAAGFIIAAIVAAALSPSINSMAATTINDFYLKYVRPDADEATLLRLSRLATIFWGVVQVGVALGAQWMQQGVLDAGLSVLSLTSGSVLGAFLLGTVGRGTSSRATFIGMIVGLTTLLYIWGFTRVAWTWHALIGAAVTVLVAHLAERVLGRETAASAVS
jgi:SSS family transporter